MSGRKIPEYESDEIREVIEKPYWIIYRIKPDQIDVLAVVHSSQLLPLETWTWDIASEATYWIPGTQRYFLRY